MTDGIPQVGIGIFGAIIWPTYMGLAQGDPGDGPVPMHEPYDDVHYNRGQITWRNEDGDVVGSAQIFAPKGVYTHLIFCHGPQAMMIGKTQLEHPVVFDRPGIIDIEPIQNQDYIPRRPA